MKNTITSKVVYIFEKRNLEYYKPMLEPFSCRWVEIWHMAVTVRHCQRHHTKALVKYIYINLTKRTNMRLESRRVSSPHPC